MAAGLKYYKTYFTAKQQKNKKCIGEIKNFINILKGADAKVFGEFFFSAIKQKKDREKLLPPFLFLFQK